jgi:hypothetical protein
LRRYFKAVKDPANGGGYLLVSDAMKLLTDYAAKTAIKTQRMFNGKRGQHEEEEAVLIRRGAWGMFAENASRLVHIITDAPALQTYLASAFPVTTSVTPGQGLTLVHFLAQLERFAWDRGCA